MRGLQRLQAFRRGDDAKEADALRVVRLDLVDGVDGGTAGGEHRVEHENVTLLHVVRELAVVRDRCMGLRVAEHADVADLGGRDQVQDAVDHAETGAKDRDDGHLTAGELVRVAGADGGLDEFRLQRQVAGGFVALEHGELGDQLTKLSRTGVLISQDGEFMLDERMVGNGNSTHSVASIKSILLRVYYTLKAQSFSSAITLSMRRW